MTGLSELDTGRSSLLPPQLGVGASRQNAETTLERTAAVAREIVDDETRARTEQMARLKAARLAAIGIKHSGREEGDDIT